MAEHATRSRYVAGCRCEPCREANRDYKRAYYHRDPIREKAAQAAYRSRNQEQTRLRKADWRRRNPAYRLENQRRRKGLRDADTKRVTQREWDRIVARYGFACAYCASKRPLTHDHVVPISRGGRHAIGNLLPVCGPCNSSKNAKLLVEWKLHLRKIAERWQTPAPCPILNGGTRHVA